MADHEDELKLEREGSVAVLTLNRPQRLNALTKHMLESAMPMVLNELAEDRTVRVLVLTGAGRGFCSGADVGDVMTGANLGLKMPDPLALPFAFVSQLRNLSIPTIAAVNGIAAGAGLSFALACDLRIASEDARFGSVFIRRGLVPDYGTTFFLPNLVGSARALELMYTGDIIDAREAERIGMVNRVVPAADLMKSTMELAGRIANGPPVALAYTKRLVYQQAERDLPPQLDCEAYYQRRCRETEDFQEGVRAFQEKRQPEFRGR